MRMLVLFVSIGVVGCASTRHEMRAEQHEERADRARETGHPIRGAIEQHKANEEHRRADETRP